MKKHVKLVATIAALIIAAAGVITFEACNKKSEVVKGISESNISELPNINKEMISFGEKLKSAQKEGETMQLEEAIRLFSNYQNFSMCDASRYSYNMQHIIIESDILVNDGSVYLSDLYSLYENIKIQVEDHLDNLTGNDKNVYFIYSRTNGSGNEPGEIKIITDVLMFDDPGIPSPYYFDESMCWVVNGQSCTECTGGLAADEITSRLRTLKMFTIACPPGYTVYFYDTVLEEIVASDYPDSSSPNGYYGMIHSGYDADCLYADDMRAYLSKAIDVVDEWDHEQSVYGKVLTFIWYVPLYETLMIAEYSNVGYTLVGPDD